jgi:hypothetical protein
MPFARYVPGQVGSTGAWATVAGGPKVADGSQGGGAEDLAAAGSRQRGEGQRHREEMADGRCSEGDGEAKDADAMGPNSKASTVCGGAGRAKVEEMEAQDADAVGVEFAGVLIARRGSQVRRAAPLRCLAFSVCLTACRRSTSAFSSAPRHRLGASTSATCTCCSHPAGGGSGW